MVRVRDEVDETVREAEAARLVLVEVLETATTGVLEEEGSCAEGVIVGDGKHERVEERLQVPL